MLYHELTIILELGDISCLGESSWPVAKEDVWRHHPLHSSSYPSAGAAYRYRTQLGGLMEPHVFTRFTQLRFTADLELGPSPDWLVGDQAILLGLVPHGPADTDKLPQMSFLLEALVQLLSHSPCLRRLSFVLSIDVCEHALDDNEGAIHARAVAIFMESRVLERLHKLSNVQSFEFEFDLVAEGTPYLPSAKHREIARNLKEAIESNWRQSRALAI